MGYYATGGGNVIIPKNRQPGLELIIKSHTDWHPSPFVSLDDFFDYWGFPSERNSADDLLIEYFDGKWRWQEEILTLLGPFAVDGNEMLFTGEDNEMWGVRYEDGVAKKLKATITWDLA